MKKIISILLCITLIIVSLSACGETPTQITKVNAKNLMGDISPKAVTKSNDLTDGNKAYYDFTVSLFKENQVNGDNILISPLSVLCALSMTANGANNNTLKEMEEVFGLSASDMNKYLYSYINGLEQGEKFSLKLANSLWITNDETFKVNNDFLQINADYHNPQMYSVDFNSEDTVKDMNNWVKKNTDGMIPSIIDESFPEHTLMCLMNALAFEAEWANIYEDIQIHEGIFYARNGASQNIDFMYNEEYNYLHDNEATGFIKYYAGEKYAFVAVLPNEDIKLEDYINNLTGEKIAKLLENQNHLKVKTKIPKFEYNYTADITEMLQNMGIKTAFDADNADFSGIGTWDYGNLFVSKVLHKTYISVAEKGTKAGAVTAVLVNGNTAMPLKELEVYLDRPFVYMIIDCENNIPFFIGTVTDVEG
ncbi:MAG: serpin family protein [Clostridia bacterium]|nr:serpin family protein [Clostridia bacterium]